MIIAVQTLVFFRESIFTIIDRIFRPYYQYFLPSIKNDDISDDEESDDHVFAEYDEEKGVVFYPPVYAQRYAAVADCLMDERWSRKLEKVVDLGCHDTSFIKYLKDIPGIKTILGVDIESLSLQCSSDLLDSNGHISKRKYPLQLKLLQGNAADPDYRLIGCDAVIAIEMIEHMLPHDLERLLHTIFGFIKPWVAVITTPNGDFNPLFKALETNGLRRLDHFFEWSRDQFHDWCSNIVMRYPQYTVSSKGIGPGPPGTEQYGCCSQLALFVAKDYHKQQDLSLNSLALVAKSPSDAADILKTFESVPNIENSDITGLQSNVDSYTEFVYSNNESSVTVALPPQSMERTFSLQSMEYREKSAQCNRDTEVGRNFLMFDEEQPFGVVIPRRKISNRVYFIEDVNTRLNCTTLHVKKFSKGANNLMAKNKSEPPAHMNEVLDEIKHLMRVLNFDKERSETLEGDSAWSNINWGDNAPYWNQYYKIVREYSYPIETQSEETRIVDLISEEINMLVDSQHFDDFTVDPNKLEIPIDHLMRVVTHITDDVDRVRDLLEWNGYEVNDGVVIYAPPLTSAGSDGNDAASDLDADAYSTSFSERSTVEPDHHGRSLYRALDEKFRKLQSMSNDQNILEEMDRVVCRLVKLAVRTTAKYRRPLPKRWTHIKLLELFTLMEKSLEKKKQHIGDNCGFITVCQEKVNKSVALFPADTYEESPVMEILDKYRQLVQSPAITEISDKEENYYDVLDDDLIHEDYLKESVSDYGDIIRSPSLVDMEYVSTNVSFTRRLFYNSNETFLSRNEAQIDRTINVVKRKNQEFIAGDIEQIISNSHRYKYKKSHKKRKRFNNRNHEIQCRKINRSKITYNDNRSDNVDKTKVSDTNVRKKLMKRKSSFNFLIKTRNENISATDDANNILSQRSLIANQQESISKHILGSFTDLTYTEADYYKKNEDLKQEFGLINAGNSETIATVKESCLIDIVTECTEETIALRRTIGTDAQEIEFVTFEQGNVSASLSNMLKMDSFCNISCCETKDAPFPPPKFVHDLSEPSTSKGVRHVSMDVQCGPDKSDGCSISSFTNLSKDLNTALKFCNSKFDHQESSNKNNCATCIGESVSYLKTIIPRVRPTGITIKDSGTLIIDEMLYKKQISEQSLTLVPVTADSATTIENVIPSIFHNASNLQMDLSASKNYKENNSLCTDYDRLSLCRGIIYVHSYKDRHINEDVVYQGDWQRYMPKSNTSKKIITSNHTGKTIAPLHRTRTVAVLSRKIMSRTKENVDLSKVNRILPKKQLPNKNSKGYILNNNDNMKTTKNITLPYNSKTCNKEVESKCLSKLTLPKRNIKMVFMSKQSSKTSNTVKQRHENDRNSIKKNYLPLYLKRRLLKLKINHNHTSNLISYQKTLKEKNDILNQNNISNFRQFNLEHRENITYVVFRNEVELKQNCSTDSESPKSKAVYDHAGEVVKVSNATLLNSSASLSPNITVAKVPSTKMTCKRNISGVSNKSNCVKNLAETTQKTLKKYKNQEKLLKNNNKENVAISNKYNNLEPIRNSFATKQNIFRAHISSENLQRPTNVNRHIPQSLIKSNDKISSSSDLIEKYTTSNDFSCPTGVKQNFLESTATSLDIRTSATSSLDATSSKTPNYNTTASNINERQNVVIVPMDNEHCAQLCIDLKKIKENEKVAKSVEMFLNNFVESETISTQVSASDSLQKFINITEHMPQTLNMFKNEQPVMYSIKNSVRNESLSPSCVQQNSHEIMTALLKTGSIWSTDSSGFKIQNKKLDQENNALNTVDNNDFDDKSDKISNFVKCLIEERLHFISKVNSDTALEVDSETEFFNNKQPERLSTNFHDVMSLNSVISDTNLNKGKSFLEIIDEAQQSNYLFAPDVSNDYSVVENDSASTLSETKQTVTDLEMLSFKSLTSVSKLSEYFLAESSIGNLSNLDKSDLKTECCIQDIFERKPPPSLQIPEGALALQAYSGFSMNTAHVTGNQLDLVNSIDSETGSITGEFIRQTASEEVLLSGRSSNSYETCVIDDDTVVPNWLFQAISQHTSEEVENEDNGDNYYDEADNLVFMPLPITEPIFDANGNIVDPGMGASAGAGDGHGIHSDNSQDSSGNGTSISSSDTSSPQSVAVIIDPTALTTQYEFMRTASSSSALVSNMQTSSDHAATSRIAVQDPDLLNSSGDPQCLPLGASDIDADVSSTDSDVPDYSDS